MTNNDIIRRLRFSFEYNDNKMISIFNHVELTVTREQVSSWLKKEDDEGYVELSDQNLANFLNGFIIEKRGKREGPLPVAETKLNYNMVLNKLKIALAIRAEDMLEMLASMNIKLSKSELSAFFRKPEHQHYRDCKAQVIRNFLMAVQNKYRKSAIPSPKAKAAAQPKSSHGKPVHSREAAPKEHKPNTARPNASKVYMNPKATKKEKPKSERKTLKLRPEDIWKNHD